MFQIVSAKGVSLDCKVEKFRSVVWQISYTGEAIATIISPQHTSYLLPCQENSSF
jgi:hypothetical protein